MKSKNTPLSATLAEAVNLWIEINGVSPEKYGTFKVADWHVRDTYEALQEANDLDPTGITSELLLSHFLDAHLANADVSMASLLKDPDGVAKRLELPRKLRALLDREELAEIRTDFQAALLKAVEHYRAHEREDVQKLLADDGNLAVLRRDTLRSMQTLRIDQFMDGDVSPLGVKPVYNSTIYKWWNVNSLLAALPFQPVGVSLHLIMHPHGYSSYFVIAIRNGARIFTLSDIEPESHPLQKYMSRRPDRTLNKRIARNWFPYDLLGLEDSEDGKFTYVTGNSGTKDLVVTQKELIPVGKVEELGAPELVWLTMMFDQIVEKFWHEGYTAKQLSYSAEMLRSEPLLLEVAQRANLPAIQYHPLALPALTIADIQTGATTQSETGRRNRQAMQQVAWFEDRYKGQVNEVVFNLTADPGLLLFLEHDKAEKVLEQKGVIEEKHLDVVDPETLGYFEKRDIRHKATRMEAFDATTFGSREEILKDRKFIAKINYARSITNLALREFNERKEEVTAWYMNRVRMNLALFTSMLGHESIWIDAHKNADAFGGGFEGKVGKIVLRRVGKPPKEHAGSALFDPRPTKYFRSFLTRYDMTEDKGYNRPYQAERIGKLKPTDARKAWCPPLCEIYGTKPRYQIVFAPGSPEEIAFVCGCTVEELPDVLQHYDPRSYYTGNSILDRIDPMLWVFKNPWMKLDLRFCLHLSNRGLAKAQKFNLLLPTNLPHVCGTGEYPITDTESTDAEDLANDGCV